MGFSATQTLSTEACQFDWRARTGPLGLTSARDALLASSGQFEIRLLGLIPFARAPQSPSLMRGELMRYLAELAWAPDAIVRNGSLGWREVSPSALVVSAGDGPTASEVMLSLGGDGRIAEAYAPDRPRAVGSGFLPTPWRGRFSDFRKQDGRWIPFAGDVAWEIDGKPDIYWQGKIECWRIG